MLPQTVLSSATKEVVIGPDHPFAVIGERINPTGRKALAAEMKAGDFSRVEADALAQVEAGAAMLDVNAGIPLADEPAILAKSIELVQSITDVPLAIDSSVVAALEAGLSVYKGKPLLNSVTGEEERLESVLPLVKKYGCAVVAISNDDSGISQDLEVRFQVAKKIVERAEAARRTRRQQHLRRVQPQLRLAEPQGLEHDLRRHGGRGRTDLGDREPTPPGDDDRHTSSQRHQRNRQGLHGLDHSLPRAVAGRCQSTPQCASRSNQDVLVAHTAEGCFARDQREDRRARRIHPVRKEGAVPTGNCPARRCPGARRRHRLGLWWTRHLRTLQVPGRRR